MLRIPLLSSSLFVAGDARNEREEWPALRSGHGPDYVTEDSTALGADFTALGHGILHPLRAQLERICRVMFRAFRLGFQVLIIVAVIVGVWRCATDWPCVAIGGGDFRGRCWTRGPRTESPSATHEPKRA